MAEKIKLPLTRIVLTGGEVYTCTPARQVIRLIENNGGFIYVDPPNRIAEDAADQLAVLVGRVSAVCPVTS